MTQFRLYDSPQSFVYDSPQSFLHGVSGGPEQWVELTELPYESYGRMYLGGNQRDDGLYYLLRDFLNPWTLKTQQEVYSWDPISENVSFVAVLPQDRLTPPYQIDFFVGTLGRPMSGYTVTTLGNDFYFCARQLGDVPTPSAINNFVACRITSGGAFSIVETYGPVPGGFPNFQGMVASRTRNKVYWTVGLQTASQGIDLYEHTPGGATVNLANIVPPPNPTQNDYPIRSTILESCGYYVWLGQNGALWAYDIDEDLRFRIGFLGNNPVFSYSENNRWISVSALNGVAPFNIFWNSIDVAMNGGDTYESVTGIEVANSPFDNPLFGCSLNNANDTIYSISQGVKVPAGPAAISNVNITDIPLGESLNCPGPFITQVDVIWPDVLLPSVAIQSVLLIGQQSQIQQSWGGDDYVNTGFWNQIGGQALCDGVARSLRVGNDTIWQMLYTAAGTPPWIDGEIVDVTSPTHFDKQAVYSLPVIAGTAHEICNIVQSSSITSIVSANLGGSLRNFPGCAGGPNECEGGIFTWRTPNCNDWLTISDVPGLTGVGIYSYYQKYQVMFRVILTKDRSLITADEFSGLQTTWRMQVTPFRSIPLKNLPIEVLTEDEAVCWAEEPDAFGSLWSGAHPASCVEGSALGKQLHRALWVNATTLDIQIWYYNKRTVDTTQPGGTVECSTDWTNPPDTQYVIGYEFFPDPQEP